MNTINVVVALEDIREELTTIFEKRVDDSYLDAAQQASDKIRSIVESLSWEEQITLASLVSLKPVWDCLDSEQQSAVRLLK